jgi:hypothetical protein
MSSTHANVYCSILIFPKIRKNLTILICRIDLKITQAAKKQFPWKKPSSCPNCGSCRLWGHGFVLRYFIGFVFGIWLKRWRCPECKAVHTVRPVQYSPRYHYPKHQQIKSLLEKFSGKPFLKAIPRQVQQHWKKMFLRQLKQRANWPDPLTSLKTQLKISQFYLSKQIVHCENWLAAESPYLTFALTTKRSPFSLE